ncbi:phage head closure protein [Enterococcus sp. LJL99]
MAQFIQTSDLKERVSFLSKEFVKDDYGQTEERNIVVATVWACIREQMLKEKVATVGTVLEGTISVIIRYRQDFTIDTSMKLKHNDLEFEIIDISKGIYKQDFTTITAKQV